MLKRETHRGDGMRPIDIFRRMDLGADSRSIAPASDPKAAIRKAIRRKLGR